MEVVGVMVMEPGSCMRLTLPPPPPPKREVVEGEARPHVLALQPPEGSGGTRSSSRSSSVPLPTPGGVTEL